MSNDNMSKFLYLNLDRNKLYEKLAFVVRVKQVRKMRRKRY